MRIPGASSLEAFWDNLLRGRVCREHLSEQSLSTGPHAGICQQANYVPYRYSINGYDAFDAAYFQMSPREASLTDPQHRLILEYATRAVENAGYVPTDVGDTKTAVFACSDVSHYLMGNVYPPLCAFRWTLSKRSSRHGHDFLATRSRTNANLQRPPWTVQTAALFMEQLAYGGPVFARWRVRPCVVASSTVLLPRSGVMRNHPGGIHSPDGLCRLLTTMQRALSFPMMVVGVVLSHCSTRVGTVPHLAVVRGTASANDGSDRSGLCSERQRAGQGHPVRPCCRWLRSEDIAYVEAHARDATWRPMRWTRCFGFSLRPRRAAPCDHPGVCKGERRAFERNGGSVRFSQDLPLPVSWNRPGTANFTGVENAFGAIEHYSVSAKQAVLRRRSGGPLLAGVSAFGFGGTNVHAVLQEPPRERSTGDDAPGQARLFPISAPTRDGVRQTSALCADRLGAAGGALLDAAYTLAVGRRQHAWRRAIVAQCAEHARRLLLADVARSGLPPPRMARWRSCFLDRANLHPQAGYDFYAGDPLFRERSDNVAHVIWLMAVLMSLMS